MLGFLTRTRIFKQPIIYVWQTDGISRMSSIDGSLPQHHCDVDAEPLERYREGGYHPTHLGDVFQNERYRIMHKLGWGAYGTVWLTKDQLCAHSIQTAIQADLGSGSIAMRPWSSWLPSRLSTIKKYAYLTNYAIDVRTISAKATSFTCGTISITAARTAITTASSSNCSGPVSAGKPDAAKAPGYRPRLHGKRAGNLRKHSNISISTTSRTEVCH